jgi:hypothetical protein
MEVGIKLVSPQLNQSALHFRLVKQIYNIIINISKFSYTQKCG